MYYKKIKNLINGININRIIFMISFLLITMSGFNLVNAEDDNCFFNTFDGTDCHRIKTGMNN